MSGGIVYLLSVAIIVCAIAPFFVSFESRRPPVRMIVLMAVMCALAVASRIAFIWVPHFKPTAAIVIISGVALGAQPGFLIGALSMLVSNFIFGQGYWTPWQMLAFGLAGLTFGLLADRGIIRRDRFKQKNMVALGVAGALFVLLVLGPILDTSTLFMFLSRITLEGAVAIYLAGLPVNAIHALATAITIILLAAPMLKKIARIREMYGMQPSSPSSTAVKRRE